MILRILDAIGGIIWDSARDTLDSAKRRWDETPRTVESELDRTIRMRSAADAKFKYIIDNDLCSCPNCKARRL